MNSQLYYIYIYIYFFLKKYITAFFKKLFCIKGIFASILINIPLILLLGIKFKFKNGIKLNSSIIIN